MSKTKFVMRVRLSGARNGVPWPNIGEPLPADLSEAEVADMVAAGFVGEVVDDAPAEVDDDDDDDAPDEQEATDAESDSTAEQPDNDAPTDPDAGDAPAKPARRGRKTAAKV